MTKEEAYTRLCHIVLDYDIRAGDVDAVDIAISALEKQIPKKPKCLKVNCPECNGYLFARWSYCPYCGQKIDWSVE